MTLPIITYLTAASALLSTLFVFWTTRQRSASK